MNQSYLANLSTAHARIVPRAVTLFDLQQQRTLWQRSLERLEDAGLGFTRGAQDLRDKLAAIQEQAK
jgi:hypothetical protein